MSRGGGVKKEVSQEEINEKERITKLKKERVASLINYLTQIKWVPLKGAMYFNPCNAIRVEKDYELEPYAVLSGRNENNPEKIESVIFVKDLHTADCCLKYNPDFNQIVLDLNNKSCGKEDCSLISCIKVIKTNHRKRWPSDKWWETNDTKA